jgi:phosphopantothenoylcysteine synthetase/decarboxylase
VIYVIACGAPTGEGLFGFVTRLQDDGWCVCVVATPSGAGFLDVERLAAVTGYPVRTQYKAPDAPDVLPQPDVYVVAPATFNTVNKIANGISDTLAVGLACEGLGYGRPVIIAPWLNRALAGHGAYRRSLDHLRAEGARLVLTARTTPGTAVSDEPEDFPWQALLTEIAALGPRADGR